MKIKSDIRMLESESYDLLNISKTTRNLGDEIGSIRRQLRQLTSLDECVVALAVQEEALMLSTAKLANMANSLRQIADVYRLSEDKNMFQLEENKRLPAVSPIVIKIDDKFGPEIKAFLYK